jgi:hypothetical protein
MENGDEANQSAGTGLSERFIHGGQQGEERTYTSHLTYDYDVVIAKRMDGCDGFGTTMVYARWCK